MRISDWSSDVCSSDLPHHQQHSLRSACPEGRRYGLTVFHLIHKVGLGCASSPVAMNVRASPLFKGMASYDPILGKSLSASLALSDVTTFISTSHALTIPNSIATHPHRSSQVQVQPRGLPSTFTNH